MELFFFDYRKLGRLGSLDIESSLAERAYRVGEHSERHAILARSRW